MRPIYLDYAATTPVDRQVAKKMADYLTVDGDYGNPASRSHMLGWLAEEAAEEARNDVADLIGADSREIVWTSGATESNNLAIKGVAENYAPEDCHIITGATEHKAVLDPVAYLKSKGYLVTILQPGRDGRITRAQVADAMTEKTRLVSLMAVNNETGVCHPVAEVGALCAERNVYFHVDAAQAIGKIHVDINDWQATLVSLSAHKFYGPKGVGALYVRRRSPLQLKAQIHGGGHERGMRSGTLAAHQLVGMGEAARLVGQNFDEETTRIGRLRDHLWLGLERIGEVSLNGDPTHRSPSHLNVCFHHVDGEALMMAVRNLAISSGSACTSATVEPSFVLKSMGLSDQDAHSSLRISLGRYTTEDDIERAISSFTEAVTGLRSAPEQQRG
ncbi:aminotransferase class V-fold PLP-dependent enzyme [Reinekea blandensis]|uniref:cysteine desulfurase n=1 Tax=Reinekea blandensis MED297 TaxID=314283 RepID=A4BH28_9GAMM|nr:aminotransferase class V-fold PLP-dependent enzyme [Reinekea blandensis]EAR08527.1 cysteine desulfurase [Reinekea sp. MED297] [Reinekea blandensis MED297]